MKITSAFLSGHFSKGAFLSVSTFSVGLRVTDPAGIFPLTETINICKLIYVAETIPFFLHKSQLCRELPAVFRLVARSSTLLFSSHECLDAQQCSALDRTRSTVFDRE